MEKKIYKYGVKIDMTKEPAEVKVSRVKDPWHDFGLHLETLAFSIVNAAKYEEKSVQEIFEYAFNYLNEAIMDYKIKSGN